MNRAPEVQIKQWIKGLIYLDYDLIRPEVPARLQRFEATTPREREVWARGYECLAKITDMFDLTKMTLQKSKKAKGKGKIDHVVPSITIEEADCIRYLYNGGDPTGPQHDSYKKITEWEMNDVEMKMRDD